MPPIERTAVLVRFVRTAATCLIRRNPLIPGTLEGSPGHDAQPDISTSTAASDIGHAAALAPAAGPLALDLSSQGTAAAS